MRIPLNTLEGSEAWPIEPGALKYSRWPCVTGPFEKPWRYITPEKPRPFDVPATLTISPLENMDALNT